MSLLKLENVSSGYGKKEVIHDIFLEIGSGEIVTLIGSNGAGKSTLLKVVYGLNEVWGSGKITFEDEDISYAKPELLLKKGIVYIGQKDNTFDTLTVEENLKTAGFIYAKKKLLEKLEMAYKLFPKLKALSSKKPSELSGGEKQLVALAMGLLHSPKLMLIDEPLTGLDVNYINKVFGIINQMKEYHGISFIITEHRVHELTKITDRWIGLKLGKKIYDNLTIDEYSLKEIFL